MLVSVGDSEHGAETTREVEKVKEKKKMKTWVPFIVVVAFAGCRFEMPLRQLGYDVRRRSSPRFSWLS